MRRGLLGLEAAGRATGIGQDGRRNILMYADSGCEFKGSIEPLLKMLEKPGHGAFSSHPLRIPVDERRRVRVVEGAQLPQHQAAYRRHPPAPQEPQVTAVVKEWAHGATT